jgi:hypothetical protein
VAGTKSGNALEQEVVGDNDSFAMRVVPPPFIAPALFSMRQVSPVLHR